MQQTGQSHMFPRQGAPRGGIAPQGSNHSLRTYGTFHFIARKTANFLLLALLFLYEMVCMGTLQGRVETQSYSDRK
jgi:hypothetical protein